MKRMRLLVLASLMVVAGLLAQTALPAGAGAPDSLSSVPTSLGTAASTLNVTLSVNPDTIEVGFQVTVLCAFSGGVGPYEAWVNVSGWEPYGPSTSPYPSSFGIGGPLEEPGNHKATCDVVDGTGAKGTATANVRVIPSPNVDLEASDASIPEGGTVTLTANASGGVGPMTYLWLNLPPGCPYGNASVVTCTPTASGTWTVTVSVRDAWGVVDGSVYTVTVRERTAFLGMPPGQAEVVAGSLIIAAAFGVGLLVLSRHRKKSQPLSAAPPVPEPQAQGPEVLGESGGASATSPLASWWSHLPALTQKLLLLAALVAVSGAFYGVVTALASDTPELTTVGLPVVLYTLGLVLIVVSVKLLGFLLPGAGLAGGVTLYVGISQPLSSCTSDPATASDLGVPTCGALSAVALAAGIVVVLVAVGATVFLLRWRRGPWWDRSIAVVGTLVLAGLVLGSTVALMTPPRIPPGQGRDTLPFPLHAGSGFVIPLAVSNDKGNFTRWAFEPQLFVPVTAAGFAPTVLVGGWNSTASVCLYVGNVNYGILLPPPMAAFGDCGTNVTFHYRLKPATWVVQFYIETYTVSTAAVTITRTFELVS